MKSGIESGLGGDLLILTLRSMRGREHGELNAANRFGEIFVAL